MGEGLERGGAAVGELPLGFELRGANRPIRPTAKRLKSFAVPKRLSIGRRTTLIGEGRAAFQGSWKIPKAGRIEVRAVLYRQDGPKRTEFRSAWIQIKVLDPAASKNSP